MVIAWASQSEISIESELVNRFALFGLTGHALWTGLAGAGLGLARTLMGSRQRLLRSLRGLPRGHMRTRAPQCTGDGSVGHIRKPVGVGPGESTSLPLAWAFTVVTWLVIEGPFMILMVLCLFLPACGNEERSALACPLESAEIVTEPELAAALHESLWKNRRLEGMPKTISRRWFTPRTGWRCAVGRQSA